MKEEVKRALKTFLESRGLTNKQTKAYIELVTTYRHTAKLNAAVGLEFSDPGEEVLLDNIVMFLHCNDIGDEDKKRESGVAILWQLQNIIFSLPDGGYATGLRKEHSEQVLSVIDGKLPILDLLKSYCAVCDRELFRLIQKAAILVGSFYDARKVLKEESEKILQMYR